MSNSLMYANRKDYDNDNCNDDACHNGLIVPFFSEFGKTIFVIIKPEEYNNN